MDNSISQFKSEAPPPQIKAHGRMELTPAQTISTSLVNITMNSGSINATGVWPFNEVALEQGGMIVNPGSFEDNVSSSQAIGAPVSEMIVPVAGKYRFTLALPSTLDSTVGANDRPLPTAWVNSVEMKIFNVNDLSDNGSDGQDTHNTCILDLEAGDTVQAGYYIEGGQAEAFGFRAHIEDAPSIVYSYFELEQLTNFTAFDPSTIDVPEPDSNIHDHTVGVEIDTGEKWHDGRTIYRQTFTYEYQSIVSPHDVLSGVREVIDAKGSGYNVQFSSGVRWPQYQHEGDTSYSYPHLSGTTVQIYFSSNFGGGSPSPLLGVTLWYTKS